MEGIQVISIIISTYNRANLLPQAIKGVVKQTYSNWELLIIDDGSTDNTEEVLQKYLSSKIRYVKCPHSGLPAIARNVGIREAQGEWIAFLDSDDVWLPEKLERQMQVIRDRRDVSLVCTNAHRKISETDSDRMEEYVSSPDRKVGIYFEELLLENFVVTSTALVRKDCLLAMEGYSESPELRAVEDYELWLRLSISHKIEYLSEPLVIYRDLPEEGIRGSQSKLGYWKGILKIYCNLRKIRAKQGLQVSRVLEDRIFSTRMEILKIYFKWESSAWNVIRTFLEWVRKIFLSGENPSVGSSLETDSSEEIGGLSSDDLYEYAKNHQGKVRLHLGSGETYFKGYINIDFPSSEHTIQVSSLADCHTDIRKLNFPPFSIAEIRLHHVFEHFDRPTFLKLLVQWHTWLVEEGQIIIEVPDFNRCARRILNPFISWNNKASTMRHLFGSHEADWAYHLTSWNRQRFKHTLGILGFEVIGFHYSRWKSCYNLTVKARKLVSLSKNELEKRAIPLLRESMVDDSSSENRILEVWKKRLLR